MIVMITYVLIVFFPEIGKLLSQVSNGGPVRSPEPISQPSTRCPAFESGGV